MPTMTGGRFIAETLRGHGITHVFFMPVIAVRALLEMEALGITRIMTHGEKAAAYMADGYARVAGHPGICMSQSVGAANLAAGLQDPYLANAPVIALTGRRPQHEQLRHGYQEVEHLAPFDAVTKYNTLVTSVEQLPQSLRQAFREALSSCPGPVHLDLDGTSGQLITDAEGNLEVVVEEPFKRLPPFRPEPDPASISEAARVIAAAKKPVIVAGGGVAYSEAGGELVALAEKLSIPVAVSLNGKGTIPDGHPLCVGLVGRYSRWCANQIVAASDLVIYVGSHTGSMVTADWLVPPAGTRTLQINIDPRELGRSYPVAAAVQADARAALAGLLEVTTESEGQADWLAWVREKVADWRKEVEPLATSDARPIRPERLCRELTGHLPENAILVADTGHAGIWTGTMVELRHPGQRYIRCAGSLGWGFPAAMGAKCAAPDRPVVCFTGDGGIWYHLSELETAMRYGINTVTVVNNNHSLNQERFTNERTYAKQTPGSDELWIFPDSDFAKIAQSMGAVGLTVEHAKDFPATLRQALASDRPAIIDVKSDIEGIAPRAWTPS